MFSSLLRTLSTGMSSSLCYDASTEPSAQSLRNSSTNGSPYKIGIMCPVRPPIASAPRATARRKQLITSYHVHIPTDKHYGLNWTPTSLNTFSASRSLQNFTISFTTASSKAEPTLHQPSRHSYLRNHFRHYGRSKLVWAGANSTTVASFHFGSLYITRPFRTTTACITTRNAWPLSGRLCWNNGPSEINTCTPTTSYRKTGPNYKLSWTN